MKPFDGTLNKGDNTSRELTNFECQNIKTEGLFYGEKTTRCICGNRRPGVPKLPVLINQKWAFGFPREKIKWQRYCCSLTPCERMGHTIHCKNGTVKKTGQKCGISDCPTAKKVSSSAISPPPTNIIEK